MINGMIMALAALLVVFILLFSQERRARIAAEQAAEAAIKNLVDTTRERDRKVSDLADHAQMIGRATIPAIQAVRLVEWAGARRPDQNTVGGSVSTCPLCGQMRTEGHTTSCAIRQAIEAAK